MPLSLVFAAVAAVAILIVFVGLANSNNQPDPVEERLRLYGTRARSLEEIELSQPFVERTFIPLIRGMARLLNSSTPQKNIEQVRHRLDLAGNPNNWTPSEFLGVRGLGGIVGAAIGTLLALSLRMDPAIVLLLFGVSAVIGFYAPIFWLGRKIKDRQKKILKQLPDAMDLLTISVESGLGFDAAMSKVAEKWDNELSRAFARVLSEIRVGKLRREGLRDMAARIEVPDFTNFIAAIIQADQLGVSIAKVLRIQSEQMRVKRRQRAEEQANQAPIKMLIPLAFLVFPSIFIVLLGPTVLIFVNNNPLNP